MSLGRLAAHLAEIPEWADTIVNDESFDMDAADYKPKELSSRQEILDYFDKNVENFKKVMSGQSDEHLFKSWKLLAGGHTAVDMRAGGMFARVHSQPLDPSPRAAERLLARERRAAPRALWTERGRADIAQRWRESRFDRIKPSKPCRVGATSRNSAASSSSLIA